MNKNVIGITGSILLHTAFALAILAPVAQSHKATVANHTETEAPTKEADVVEIFAIGQGTSDGVGSALDANGKPCDKNLKTYDGVGFIYSKTTGQVLNAPVTLPAYQAGVRIGDLFLNNPDVDADGNLTLSILKYGATHPTAYTIKAIKICFQEAVNN